MSTYPFDLLSAATAGADIGQALRERPFQDFKDTLREGAEFYEPSAELVTAINTAIAVGSPLLLTGDSGTGKTQAAYYAAWRIGLEPPLHFQVKSTSQGRDLLYTFDTVRYFRDAWAQGIGGRDETKGESKGETKGETKDQPVLDKSAYIGQGMLWQAIETKDRKPHQQVRVLLIDEIDKAPKDFPNDLLLELDEIRFTVPETAEEVVADKARRPIVFITSNSERRLSEPFLRRCVYHHITFDLDFLKKVVARRIAAGVLPPLDDAFLAASRERFDEVRQKVRQKQPSTGEYLMWLQLFVERFGPDRKKLEVSLRELELLQLLVKDKDDWRLVRA